MAIRMVVRGGTYFGSGTARRIKDFFDVGRAAPQGPLRPFPELNTSEFKTLEFLAQGKRNPDIAKELNLSEKTIRNYVSSILDKLQVSDRLQAALMANRAGIGHKNPTIPGEKQG